MPAPTAADYAAILHTDLKAQAVALYTNFLLSRTPPSQQAAMLALIVADTAAPFAPDPTKALVSHGGAVVVQDNGGGVNAKSPAVANVTLSTLNYARLAA